MKYIGIYPCELFPIKSNIDSENYQFEFLDLNTNKKFYEYDGIFIHNKAFVKKGNQVFYKREKEVIKLLRKGGFLCFLIFDDDLGDDPLFKKYTPKFNTLDRKKQGLSIEDIKHNEFKNFFDQYGIAHIFFDSSDPHDIEIISTEGETTTTFIHKNSIFFYTIQGN